VWTCTFDCNTEETCISEVAVNSRNAVHEFMWLNSWVCTAWSWSECLSTSQKLVNKMESSNIVVTPWYWLECKLDAGCGGFSPGSIFTTNVFRLFTDVVVLRNC
jgi:hypothetical protein